MSNTIQIRIAKASPEEVDALLNLMRVLNSVEDDKFPCKPDGTWECGEEYEWFDDEDFDCLKRFHQRVTACFAKHPGGITRAVAGFHLAMTNDVFNPNVDHYAWHPDLVEVISKRWRYLKDEAVEESKHGSAEFSREFYMGDVSSHDEKPWPLC
jgi:hypothetical protein